MKKVKIVILLAILGLIVLIGYQNMDFIVVAHQFGINLLFFNYQSPEIQNGVLLLGFFVAGLLLAFIVTLRGRWQSARQIKALAREVDSCREQKAALEKELAGLKAGSRNLEAVDGNAGVSS